MGRPIERGLAFLQERKLLKVLQVGIAYLVAAWVVIEAVDVTFLALHLPEWTVTLVMAIAVAGVPIALVLLRALEIIPQRGHRKNPAAIRRKDVRSLFDELADLDHGARQQRLAEIDPALRRDVASLLQAHDHADDVLQVLDQPVSMLSAPVSENALNDPYRLIGRAVSHYRVKETLGAGGMGIVYRARDARLDRTVALKFLPPHLRLNETAKQRFIQEAKAASALDHPNICTVYEIGETHDGHLFIAMACYDGMTLEEHIRQGPMDIDDCLEITVQTLRALGRAHEAGIVHRDVKPVNIMITTRDSVKILDFGVAKLDSADSVTKTGTVVGTVAYMAPEQVRRQPVDERADLWALGVVLYEMLTGIRPFRGGREAALLHAILHDDPPPPTDLRPNIPRALDRIAMRLLAKQRVNRYACADDLLADLQALRRRSLGGLEKDPPSEPSFPVLPRPLTNFVGRTREIAQVEALLKKTRLLTLTGPGGAGKTRLALEVAAAAGDTFPDSVLFVPLASIRDPELVIPTVAQAVGLPDTAPQLPLRRLVDHLKHSRLLLVLDNFEQVAPAAPRIAELLAGCPNLTVFVTSRTTLHLSGEQEFAVPPLELPDAVAEPDLDRLPRYSAIALFIERTRAIHPRFELTGANARAVTEICFRLDGLPLAIELAAARTKLFSPPALLTQLDRRFDVLTDGPRDRPPRHQTLRQAIAWSYNLLNEAEQSLFRQLSVFVGGCTLAAAEDVCTLPDVLGGLAALVDKSLLCREEGENDTSRFFMLETIREYGLDRLRSAGEENTVRRAHAACFLQLAEQAEPQLTGPDQAGWLDRLEAEHDNIRTALSWAAGHDIETGLRIGGALWRFWVIRGYLREGRERLEHLLSLSGVHEQTQARARALNGVGTLAHEEGRHASACSYLQESLDIAQAIGDEACMATVLNNLGWIACELRSDFDTAKSLSRQALALNRELGNRRGIGVALNNLGFAATYQGDFAHARFFHEENLALRRELGDRRGVAFALINLGWVDQRQGRYEDARQRLEKAMVIVHSLEDMLLAAWGRLIQGYMAHDQEHYEEAKRLLEESESRWQQAGKRYGDAVTLVTLANLACDRNDRDRATQLVEAAHDFWKETKNQWGFAWRLYVLGRLADTNGQIDDAVAVHRRSLQVRQRIGDKLGIADSLEALAHARSEQGEPLHAARLLGAAETVRRTIEAPLPPCRHADYRRLVAAVRNNLGAGIFAGAQSAGRAMQLEKAAEYALHPLDVNEEQER